MTSLRALSLAVVLIGGIPASGFAVTGRDAAGNENGTPGSLTGPNQLGPTDQTTSQTPPAGAGTTVGPAAQNPQKPPLGYAKGPGENSPVGKK
jgi:hypothetical protein